MKTLKRVFAICLVFTFIFGIAGETAYLVTGKTSTSTAGTTMEISKYPIGGFSSTLNEMCESTNDVSVQKSDAVMVGASYVEEGISRQLKNNEANPNVIEEIQKPVITRKVKELDKTMYTNASVLNVRKTTSTDSEVIKKLTTGTEVKVIQKIRILEDGDTKETWFKIDTSAGPGYVKSEYLQNECPLIYMGEYWITYYCACAICCGKETGITASGNPVQAGVTIAADRSFPFGTKLIIDGHTYTVHDRGGAIKGKHIDIYCATHSEALYEHANHWASVYMDPESGKVSTN